MTPREKVALKPSFGDVIENEWASDANPTRTGFFVREFTRTGRLNPGVTWEITDGKGKFWEFKPKDISEGGRLKVTSRTALASGSGDHAELARNLRAFEGSDDLGNGDFTVCEFGADSLEALIAENAALRGADERTGELLAESNLRESRATVRATEAERKLAEARGLLERTDPFTSSLAVGAAELRQAIRTFLSSTEAERG
ncbi:hypothetical protein [Brevundimonas sp.]|uniref:hypothetical protein n=1 Tax=Brevundimonas sp. TaxID=1871086 RepID=UPI0025C3F95D|nr:hypothetical protein [Brevundimonas sp.]